jgi:hypothetical protein
MTNEELKLAKELVAVISATMDTLRQISKLTVELSDRINQGIEKAQDALK